MVLLLLPWTALTAQRRPPASPPRLARVDSVYDAFAGTTTLSVLNTPNLWLNKGIFAYPSWTCQPNTACTLTAIEIAGIYRKVPLADVMDDEAAQAYWALVVTEADVDWDFLVEGAADTVRFRWALDSLTYRTHMRRQRSVLAASSITDPVMLRALLGATTLHVRQRWRVEGATKDGVFIVTETERWLRVLQASHRRLTTGRDAARNAR